MEQVKYMNNDFDISRIDCFNNIDGLTEISNYLDFAITSTINTQKPNSTDEKQRYYATQILQRYLSGSQHAFSAFTKNYAGINVRQNTNKIGPDKVRFLLCRSLIERDAYNKRVYHMIEPTEYIDKMASYVSEQVAFGNFDSIQEWLRLEQNQDYLISNYVYCFFKLSPEDKEHRYDIALEQPTNAKALQQLNLEMHMQSIKQK